MAKHYPDGSASALSSAAISLFALLMAFLGYTSLRSDDPWSWGDLFLLIIPAILGGAALISVPWCATQQREVNALDKSVRTARWMFVIGSCLVMFVIFTWFVLNFLSHHTKA
jgi:uncharacterized membrane-anchored protein